MAIGEIVRKVVDPAKRLIKWSFNYVSRKRTFEVAVEEAVQNAEPKQRKKARTGKHVTFDLDKNVTFVLEHAEPEQRRSSSTLKSTTFAKEIGDAISSPAKIARDFMGSLSRRRFVKKSSNRLRNRPELLKHRTSLFTISEEQSAPLQSPIANEKQVLKKRSIIELGDPIRRSRQRMASYTTWVNKKPIEAEKQSVLPAVEFQVPQQSKETALKILEHVEQAQPLSKEKSPPRLNLNDDLQVSLGSSEPLAKNNLSFVSCSKGPSTDNLSFVSCSKGPSTSILTAPEEEATRNLTEIQLELGRRILENLLDDLNIVPSSNEKDAITQLNQLKLELGYKILENLDEITSSLEENI